ncbi:DUF1798 family protein [Bacillus sp. FJAT-27445]|uniref:DUF1798 family protein n=1 Tax=Bacillus sp. FJAT-27445 TaxID=1679166 RepID=UPI00074421CD|nr:DUF1798 family protein [Bacillus sp. FJAT-27445]
MTETLATLTARLIEYNKEFNAIFERTREKNEDGDFYNEVKPYADAVKEKNDAWKEEATRQAGFILGEGISTRQIELAHEHIERLSIQAFFVKTSRKIFLNSSRTVDYTLNSLLEKLEGTGRYK